MSEVIDRILIDCHLNSIQEAEKHDKSGYFAAKIHKAITLSATRYAEWLLDNCMVSRNGWISSSVPRKWEGEKTNEQTYELYLESLKK